VFQSLPQETVFEARAKARRDTAWLVLLLIAVYAACFGLMGFSLFFFFGGFAFLLTLGLKVALAGMLLGAVIALAQYGTARFKNLDELLETLAARPADSGDEYHGRVFQLVREVESATDLRNIRVTVIPSPALNAFSLADSSGNMAIGVTEGLISRLNRNELGAVVAHEAAHLVQGDSRLLTMAGSLSSSFESIADVLSPFNRSSAVGTSPGAIHRGGGVGPGVLLVWLVATFGKIMTRLLSMALSRNREYLADAQAVRMTQNPLALAEALRKIAGKYKGAGDVPTGFEAVFILNPNELELDESESAAADLFSTHPPVGSRIRRLLDWAGADLAVLHKSDEASEAEKVSTHPPDAKYFAFSGDQWKGPLTCTQWLAAGNIRPDTWICPEGSATVFKAGDSPELSPLFAAQVQDSVASEKCPHCHVPLLHRTYEGAPVSFCAYCSGYLLESGVLERIVARREKTFDASDVQKAVEWRKAQREGSIQDASCGVHIACPCCGRMMSKAFHLLLTRVVMDRCPYDGKIWLDGGELELIQILVEQASKLYGLKSE
jgi:heat shock protein HtpX